MKTTLYLGTDPTEFEGRGCATGHLIHYPVIKIVPRPLNHPEIRQAFDDIDEYTHLIFTSKNAVKVFFLYLPFLKKSAEDLKEKTVIAIGEVTASHLCAFTQWYGSWRCLFFYASLFSIPAYPRQFFQ
jgi:uroporphyrinogen-III synthase